MAKYNFRILLETIEGRQFSYYSSSFVDTSVDTVLSSSQVYNRITGSVSASYQNTSLFSGSTILSSNDIDISKTFKDNVYLSASLSGSNNTGSIIFTALENEYDRLLRYKFIGSDKVCNVLGLPSEQWVYVDQIRLPVDDEANYFEGNLKASQLYVEDTITFANTSNLNSDLPILINTGSDRYIKFIDNRGIPSNALKIGYDVDTDYYEISASVDSKISGFTTGSITQFDSSDLTAIQAELGGTSAGNRSIIRNSSIEVPPAAAIAMHDGDTNNPQALSGANTTHIKFRSGGGIAFRAKSSSETMFLSQSRVGIGTTDNDGDDITHTLTVVGDISASGLFVGGDISASGDIIAENYIVKSSVTEITTSFSSGSTRFGDSGDDTHQFTGSLLIGSGSSIIAGSGSVLAVSHMASILGGNRNSISGSDVSVIIGGTLNSITQSQDSSIIGGNGNVIDGTGGVNNKHVIVGGSGNEITGSNGNRHFIGGGGSNKIHTSHNSLLMNTIVGGGNNIIGGSGRGFIGGGDGNHIIAGDNAAGAEDAHIIGGGTDNKINLIGGTFALGGSAILGGSTNEITGSTASDFMVTAVIVGGSLNKIYTEETLNSSPFIGGGSTNRISDSQMTNILGGSKNTINNSDSSSILGGSNNEISGTINNAFILGSSITAQVPDTTYTQNLSISGDVTASGDITASGHISASHFSGDGSGLSNVSATATVPAGTVSSSIQLGTDITGSFFAPSSSISTRLTTAETELDNTLVSGSLQLATDISGSFTLASASISTRLTTAETELDNTLVSSSGQFSTDNVVFNTVTASSDISSSGIISGSKFAGDGTSLTNVTATPPAGTVSSSIQLGTDITGSFFAPSSSISTRLTTAEAELDNTLVSSSGQFSTDNVVFNTVTASSDISSSGTISGSLIHAETLDADAVTDNLASIIVAEIDNDEIPIAKLAEDAITIAGTSTALGGSITSIAILNNGKATVTGSFFAPSSSISTRLTTAETELNNTLVSGSLQLATDISGSFTPASASISTRLTTAETELDNTLVSGSLQLATDISGSFTLASASISTRLTTAETELDNTLVSSSGQFSTDNVVFNTVTASSDISSSGAIKGGSLDINGNADFGDGNITNVGNISVDAVFDDATDGDTRLTLADVSMVARVEDTEVVSLIAGKSTFTGDISASGAINTLSHITASGNISASGNITAVNVTAATDLYAGRDISIGRNLMHVGDTDTLIGFTTEKITTTADSIVFNGQITASGDISSSGTLISNEINTIGHITASGNISSSGIIETSELYINNPEHKIGGFSIDHGDIETDLKSALGNGYGDIMSPSAVTTIPGVINRLQTNGNFGNKADKDDLEAATSLLGVTLGTNATKGMLLRGFAQVSQSGQLSVGQKVYLGDNGIVTGSVADFASGDFVRIMGHCIDGGNLNGSASIYFNPDNSFIELA